MSRSPLKPNVTNNVAVSIIGLCVGVLVGMSVTPVLSAVITGVMALLGTIASALSGLENVNQRRVNPIPLAFFTVLLVIGAFIGVFIRTNKYISAAIVDTPVDQWKREIDKWESYGLDAEFVAKRIFLNAYPPIPGEFPLQGLNIEAELNGWASLGVTDTTRIGDQLLGSTSLSEHEPIPLPTPFPTIVTGLTSERVEECDEMNRLIRKVGVQEAFLQAPNERWEALAVITDTVILGEIYEQDLCLGYTLP